MRKLLTTIIIVLLLCVMSGTGAKAETSFSLLTNDQTDIVEARIEWDVDPLWSVGVLGSYFEAAEDPREDWAAGCFFKLSVDPNATLPIAGWIPEIGDWLNLPDEITVNTYIIGKGEIFPCFGEKEIDIVASIGAGGEVGPVIIEYVYRIIEGGDANNPLLFSGPVLYFGLKPVRW